MKIYTIIFSILFLVNIYANNNFSEKPNFEKCFSRTSSINIIKEFIKDKQKEINETYGTFPDISNAIDFLKEYISIVDQLSYNEKEMLFQICNYISAKEEWYKNSMKTHRFGGKKQKKSGDFEFTLPDKMAGGFMTMLAGSLLCIIPGGQCIGLGLVIDGLANGERPYYLDPKTGKKYSMDEIHKK